VPQLDSLGEKIKSREGINLVVTARPELVRIGQDTAATASAARSPWELRE
jgi:hypothetical protein